MGKRKPKEPAMGTSLGDLLFQKNLKREGSEDRSRRLAELERKNAVLAEQNRLLEELCGKLEASNKALKEEADRLEALVKELQPESVRPLRARHQEAQERPFPACPRPRAGRAGSRAWKSQGDDRPGGVL
ncbi:MAG: hypothetical protein ACLGPL_12245 [Acidobacteriota bacterium]